MTKHAETDLISCQYVPGSIDDEATAMSRRHWMKNEVSCQTLGSDFLQLQRFQMGLRLLLHRVCVDTDSLAAQSPIPTNKETNKQSYPGPWNLLSQSFAMSRAGLAFALGTDEKSGVNHLHAPGDHREKVASLPHVAL